MKESNILLFEYKTYFSQFICRSITMKTVVNRQNTAQLLAFPTQADKTEAITGQVAYHILSVVKQKPSGRTNVRLKMNWNFK